MKALPKFGYQEFYIIEEDLPMDDRLWMTDWKSEMVMKDEYDDFHETVKYNLEPEDYAKVKFKETLHKVANHKFLKEHVFGKPVDWESSGHLVVGEVCPKCKEYYLCKHERSGGLECSAPWSDGECEYADKTTGAFRRSERLKHENNPHMTIPNKDYRKHAEELGLELDTKLDDGTVKEDMFESCNSCGHKTDPKDVECFRSKDFKGISYDCVQCDSSQCMFTTVPGSESDSLYRGFL